MKTLKYFQDLADILTTAFPVPMELEVRLDEPIGDDQGEFYIEGWEGADPGEEVPADKMVVSLAQFEKMPREELESLLAMHVFIHEMAHALQFRTVEYEEEREGDHDAEWGVKFAQVYEFLMESGATLSEEDRDAILGLTPDTKALIINNLAAAISRDMENEPND